MSRPKYTIAQNDFRHAWSYLQNKIFTLSIEIDKVANRRFHEIASESNKKQRASSLNVWCEQNLDAKKWRKLKSAILKRRQRWLSADSLTTISVSNKVHRLLKKLASREKLKFNEVLERVLERAAKSARLP